MKRTLTILTVYAVAMALLEAAVVVYMRRLYYLDNPLDLFPLHFLDTYDSLLELSREAATVAICSVFQSRLGNKVRLGGSRWLFAMTPPRRLVRQEPMFFN